MGVQIACIRVSGARLRTAGREGKERAYLGVLVAGEGPDEDRAKYGADRPSYRRQEMERERERERSDSNEEEGWSGPPICGRDYTRAFYSVGPMG